MERGEACGRDILYKRKIIKKNLGSPILRKIELNDENIINSSINRSKFKEMLKYLLPNYIICVLISRSNSQETTFFF